MTGTRLALGKISDIYQKAAKDDVDLELVTKIMQTNMKHGNSSLEVSFENDTGKTCMGQFQNAIIPLDLAQQAASYIGDVVSFEFKEEKNKAIVTAIKPINP